MLEKCLADKSTEDYVLHAWIPILRMNKQIVLGKLHASVQHEKNSSSITRLARSNPGHLGLD